MKEIIIKSPTPEDSSDFAVVLAGISYCDKNYKIYRPNSNVASIEYVISGKGTVQTGEYTLHPKAGDSFLLRMGDDHFYYSSADDPWVKIWINVTGKIADNLINAYSIDIHTVFVNCSCEELIQKIHDTLQDKSLTPREIKNKTSLYFHQILQLFSDEIAKISVVTSEAEELKWYIDNHLYSPLNISELADHIYKSSAQTIRIFKKSYGVTPYDYYNDCRIERAILLLKSTNFSIKEIARKLCFTDEHYFSNVFKKKTGKKPSDYRQKDF